MMPMTSTDVNVTEMVGTFRRAAEMIRIGGLAKRAYEDGTRHCIVGALMMARGVPMFSAITVQPEVSYLVELIGGVDSWSLLNDPSSDTITHWNDAASRTADDVATLLEQAAEKLEADL